MHSQVAAAIDVAQFRCIAIHKNNRSTIENDCSNYWFIMNASATVLFGKTRQAVLATLFENPERTSYLRELSRQTGISPGALQHELGQLQQADLVIREQDGNRVTYRANMAHPIYPDLRAIVQKTCGLPAQIQEALAACDSQISFAAIYGSMAKGLDHAHSDVDLLVVGDITLEKTLTILQPIETRIGREISVRLYKPQEFRKRREENESFLVNVLNGPHTILKGAIDDA
jgi:predicted nucleotidyltransferase/DNA-binding HxlR family transcriptional regulator